MSDRCSWVGWSENDTAGKVRETALTAESLNIGSCKRAESKISPTRWYPGIAGATDRRKMRVTRGGKFSNDSGGNAKMKAIEDERGGQRGHCLYFSMILLDSRQRVFGET